MEDVLENVRNLKEKLASKQPNNQQFYTSLLNLGESLAINHKILKNKLENIQNQVKHVQNECLLVNETLNETFANALKQAHDLVLPFLSTMNGGQQPSEPLSSLLADTNANCSPAKSNNNDTKSPYIIEESPVKLSTSHTTLPIELNSEKVSNLVFDNDQAATTTTTTTTTTVTTHNTTATNDTVSANTEAGVVEQQTNGDVMDTIDDKLSEEDEILNKSLDITLTNGRSESTITNGHMVDNDTHQVDDSKNQTNNNNNNNNNEDILAKKSLPSSKRKQIVPTRRILSNDITLNESILDFDQNVQEENELPINREKVLEEEKIDEEDFSEFTKFEPKMMAYLCKNCSVVLERLNDNIINNYKTNSRSKRACSMDSQTSNTSSVNKICTSDFIKCFIEKEKRLYGMENDINSEMPREIPRSGKKNDHLDSSFDPVDALNLGDYTDIDTNERDTPSISFETSQEFYEDHFSKSTTTNDEKDSATAAEDNKDDGYEFISSDSDVSDETLKQKASKKRRSCLIIDSDSEFDPNDCDEEEEEDGDNINDDDDDSNDLDTKCKIPLPKMPRLDLEESSKDSEEVVQSKNKSPVKSRLKGRAASSDTTTSSDSLPKLEHRYSTRNKKTAQKKRVKPIESSSNDDHSNDSANPKIKAENLSFQEKYAYDEDEVCIIENEKEKNKNSKLDSRKKLRAIIQDSNLKKLTKDAYKSEKERAERLKSLIDKREKVMNENLNSSNKKILCLDYDHENNTPLLSVDSHITAILKPHQIEGIKFMWDACFESIEQIQKGDPGSGCLLSHCMGLGKTLQVVALLHTVLTNSSLTNCKRALIVVPKNVLTNWENEFDKWTKKCPKKVRVYSFKKCDGRDAEVSLVRQRAGQLEKWFTRGGVFVLSYTLFSNMILNGGNKSKKIGRLLDEYLRDPGPDIIVCDEGHTIKSDTTNLTAAVNTIGTKRRIVLTGTPLQNNLMEYYNMVQFIKPNLLGDKKEFQNRFANPINNGTMKDSTETDVRLMKKRAHILHNTLEFCVQRKDYSVIRELLPPKNEYVLSIKLSDKQTELYSKYLSYHGIDFQNIGVISGTQLFSDFHNLSCVWTHPFAIFLRAIRSAKNKPKKVKSAAEVDSELDDLDLAVEPKTTVEETKYWQELITEDCKNDFSLSSKLIVFESILNKCEALGDKLVVFSQSLVSLDLIELFLKYLNESSQSSWKLNQDYFRMDGQTETSVRDRQVETFNSVNKKKCRLFLISTKSGGVGINLVAANRCIIFDACFNPCHDTQSIFRIYRFGQTKEVFVYRFLAHGTMEEKIYQRQVNKQSLSQRVLDEHQLDRHFTRSELAEMYRFEPDKWAITPLDYPKDDLLKVVISEHKNLILKIHEHDSLLENRIDEGLSVEEREAAWREFELEKDRERERAEYMNRIAEQNSVRINNDYVTSQLNNLNNSANSFSANSYLNSLQNTFNSHFANNINNFDDPFQHVNENFQLNNLLNTEIFQNLMKNNQSASSSEAAQNIPSIHHSFPAGTSSALAANYQSPQQQQQSKQQRMQKQQPQQPQQQLTHIAPKTPAFSNNNNTNNNKNNSLNYQLLQKNL